MRRIAEIALVAGCCVGGTGSASVAADDVGVYVDNPGIANYIEAANVLRQQLPAARARWNEVAATGATFTITFMPGGARHRATQPCEGVPVSVRVRNDRVTSATYALSASGCKAGAAVKAADDPYVYSLLSPNSLFQEVSSRIEQGVQGQACIDASFDADFGLPTTFHEGCPWLKESDFRIQISDIVSTQQRFWNLAVTLAGGLLVLFGLAYYHYKQWRRRQEAMPELLLR
jgi:Family of unknown function (DUF6174)